jgi:hypothetical protein
MHESELTPDDVLARTLIADEGLTALLSRG